MTSFCVTSLYHEINWANQLQDNFSIFSENFDILCWDMYEIFDHLHYSLTDPRIILGYWSAHKSISKLFQTIPLWFKCLKNKRFLHVEECMKSYSGSSTHIVGLKKAQLKVHTWVACRNWNSRVMFRLNQTSEILEVFSMVPVAFKLTSTRVDSFKQSTPMLVYLYLLLTSLNFGCEGNRATLDWGGSTFFTFCITIK